MAIVHPNW